MGVLTILQGTVIFLLLVAYMPGLPPYDAEFTAYSVTPSLPYEGPLALNHRLDNAEHLFEGQLQGPECFASFNGELYTGIEGGEIVRIVSDNKMVTVAKLGKPCEGLWEEHICGRPLGMRFDKNGILYVADAYYGIHRINVKTGASTTLVSMSVPIEGRVPSVPNSLAIASDGTVYWSDSILNFRLHEGVYSTLADATGRLLRYDPKTNSSTVLINKLHFANGVALSLNEDFVVVSDLHRSRLIRYYLKGAKKGTHDVFLDGIPGLPDNLASDGKGGFLVALAQVTGEDHPLISQTIAPYPTVRRFLARLLALIELPFLQIEAYVPNYYTKRITHWIGHINSVTFLHPNRAAFLVVDASGNIKESFYSLDGSLTATSEVHIANGYYYFGSYNNKYIGRVKIENTKQQTAKKS